MLLFIFLNTNFATFFLNLEIYVRGSRADTRGWHSDKMSGASLSEGPPQPRPEGPRLWCGVWRGPKGPYTTAPKAENTQTWQAPLSQKMKSGGTQRAPSVTDLEP